MPKKSRNYRKEYRERTQAQKNRRSPRRRARRAMGLSPGDPREVDHKVPMSKGGGNGRSNLRVVSRSYNRKKAASSRRKR